MIETEEEFATPLKESIRAFCKANTQYQEAQRDKQVPSVVAFYEEEMRVKEALVMQLQRQTETLVLTGDDGCEYGDDRIDAQAVEMLLSNNIVHECLDCEERPDLSSVYGGDHREFHLSGDHHEPCIGKALHEYDQTRWPTYESATDEFDSCEECGVSVAA